jgi:tRNA-Thr(GGU) m(6)t(6)A37 methyltransferase TsaA
MKSFTISPIGWIHKNDGDVSIEIEREYEDALLGIEGFSHVWVIWWLDRNDSQEKRSTLRVHPRKKLTNPLTGVFATRSPVRPNLVAMSLCEIRSVEGNLIRIGDIDASDRTPVVDLKPYIPSSDEVSNARVPSWIHDC